MDDTAPITVAKGVLVSTGLGAVVGGSIGAIRSQNPVILSLNMSLNCGVAGLAFFGMREYAISPALRLLFDRAVQRTPTVSDVRTNNLLSSALSGAFTGAIMSGSFRGPATIPRAALTSAVMTLCLQSAVNELRIIRLRSLAKSQAEPVTIEDKIDSQSLPSKIMSALAVVTPVRQLSDDEYWSVLQNRQRDIQKRLAAIDRDQQRVFESLPVDA